MDLGDGPPPPQKIPFRMTLPRALLSALGLISALSATFVKGESLEKIAKSHGTTVPELQKINRISDPKKLQIGQQLLLPPPTPKKESQ